MLKITSLHVYLALLVYLAPESSENKDGGKPLRDLTVLTPFFLQKSFLHKKVDSFDQMSLSIEYQTKNTKPLAWWEVLKWPIVLRFYDFFFVQSKECFYCFFQTFFEHIFSLQFNV